MLRKMYDLMNRGLFGTGLSTDSSTLTGAITRMFPTLRGGSNNPTNFILSYGDTLPSGVAGYAIGGLFVLINVAAGTQALYANTGTTASCTFTKITDLDNLVPTGNVTIATGKTMTVTDLDKLLVGSIIVPTSWYVQYHIPKIAADTIYNAFIAPRACKVTRIDYVNTILQGGAMTITPVKATGTNAPAAATTPLVSAGFDGNGVAVHTVQNGALTATGADLVLATGNRIGIVLSTAATVMQGDMTFSLINQ